MDIATRTIATAIALVAGVVDLARHGAEFWRPAEAAGCNPNITNGLGRPLCWPATDAYLDTYGLGLSLPRFAVEAVAVAVVVFLAIAAVRWAWRSYRV